MQDPVLTSVASKPRTVHVCGVSDANETGRPEVLDAKRRTVPTLRVCEPTGVNVMVWLAGAMVKAQITSSAAE